MYRLRATTLNPVGPTEWSLLLRLDRRPETAMHLTLTPEETKVLLHHLAARIEYMDAELVHTDKHDLQRALAGELQTLRSLTDRIRSGAARGP